MPGIEEEAGEAREILELHVGSQRWSRIKNYPTVAENAVVHLHSGILPGCQKGGNLTFYDSMGGPGESFTK